MGAWDEFKTFLAQGNIVALAVAFIIATAFAAVVTALVTDIITPIVGIIVHVDFATWRLTINGSPILFGLFINAVIFFLIVAAVIFFGIVRPMAAMKKRQDAKKPAPADTTKACPYCLSQVPIKASKCMYCTSTLLLDAPSATPAATP
jgi:large conductance mechanosensitive channel